MKELIVIDIEASGFGRGSYPIEVGVASDDDNYCSLIAPLPEWRHWDEDAEQLHGISRQLLGAHGRPVQEVALALNQLLAGKLVYSDAWGNDRTWLAQLFEAAEISQHFKLEALASIMSEAQMTLWHEVKHRLSQNLDGQRHRASSDARLLLKTWHETQKASH